MFFQKATVL